MRLTEKENETLPIDVSLHQSSSINTLIKELLWRLPLMLRSFYALLQIVLQTILSFVMTCYGIVHIAGEFKDMDASSELKNK